jgi:hypothetical protein
MAQKLGFAGFYADYVYLTDSSSTRFVDGDRASSSTNVKSHYRLVRYHVDGRDVYRSEAGTSRSKIPTFYISYDAGANPAWQFIYVALVSRHEQYHCPDVGKTKAPEMGENFAYGGWGIAPLGN